jgi:tRNA dimethylallyltransferase
VLEGYNLVKVPVNTTRRAELEKKSMPELIGYLASFGPLHATTDISSMDRILKAIEQKEYFRDHNLKPIGDEKVESLVFGIAPDRSVVRQRITKRLRQRLDQGLVGEVEGLIQLGVTPERLMAFGLEYKWLTLYCTGKIDREEMFERLNTAIHQFAKRQMTWFRRMEKKGIPIFWFTKNETVEEMFNIIEEKLNKNKTPLL